MPLPVTATMNAFGLLLISITWVVKIEASPQLGLQAPGGDQTPQTGCVQGSEVMGGTYSRLPPCPPWVDSEGRCHVGDEVLQRQQCLGRMTLEYYLTLPRGRPPTLPLPPVVNQPQNIEVNPPGWPTGGSPPAGWSPSHPPGAPGIHYGPPGTNTINHGGGNGAQPPGSRSVSRKISKNRDESDILPPSIRNLRRFSQRYVSMPIQGSHMAPAPPANLMYKRFIRRLRRRNRKRKSSLFMRSGTGRRNRRRKNRRRQNRLGDSKRGIDVKLAAPPKFENKV